MKPNKTAIKEHITAVFKAAEYDDCKIELNYLYGGQSFEKDQIEEAAQYAITHNADGKNIYIVYSALVPDIAPFGRGSDSDFYATNYVWCDIDDAHDPEELKAAYKHCPPTLAIVTARQPHRRIQLAWHIKESCEDTESLREALIGLQQHLKGDPKVINPVRPMRLGGTINRPDAKKRTEKGRVDELTEYVQFNNHYTCIEEIISAFPVLQHDFITDGDPDTTEIKRTTNSLNIEDKVIDGREQYMSDMVFASILNLTKKLQRYPELQEVFNDCWPVYSKNVQERDGLSLDKAGRGSKAMQQKIRSKLRLLQSGCIRGYENLTQVNSATVDTPVLEQTASASRTIQFIYADDVTANLDVKDFVENVLSEKEFSVVYGESNCGKTFFMLDLAMHVALGLKWRGLEVEQGGVIYAALEGGHGTRNRIVAFKQHHDITGHIPLAIIPSNLNFLDADGDMTALVQAINEEKEKLGGVKLIVIDTLARAISGGDENSSMDMGQLIINADILRSLTGAHISFIHHSGKDAAKGARGHSSLRAAVDTEIEISRESTAAPSLIKIVKQREMEMIADMAFTLNSTVLGVNRRGKEVTSCVVISTEVTTQATTKPLTPIQSFIYDVIVQAVDTYGVNRTPVKDMSPVRCISYTDFHAVLDERGYKDFMETEKRTTETQVKNATTSARVSLKKAGKINFASNYIWLID